MKTLLLTSAAFPLLTAVNFAPAMALGPKPSDDNRWPGFSQPVDTASANAVVTTPRYEYQYGYDKHGDRRGQWVLVH
jgi:hypothetical protein